MSIAAPRSRFVNVNGIKTHYTESGGDGPVIIGLHGGGHGSSGAAGLGQLFELLGDQFRVIGLDSIGGYGLTDPVPMRYGLQSRVDHAAAFADALCLERFTIMGNSQGAWCAARYAMTHPDRVDNVVLLSSGSIATALGIPGKPTEGMKLLRGYDGTRPAMQRLLQGLVFNSEKITAALVDLRQSAATRPGVLEAFAESEKSLTAVKTDPLLQSGFDMRATLPLLAKTIPTAFLWGNDDIFALPEIGRQIEAAVPDIAFHWIEGAGHQVQTDQPERVAAIVADMVASTAARQ
jgi:pimeloyl-ACP methyl ester carboxylesterase